LGKKPLKKNENNPTKIWWGYFLLYICPINKINNDMKNLFIECARRDLQMMLNAIAPKHTEILVGVKTINIEGENVPEFMPMQVCKN
jgi:hypothetical protein